MTHEIFYELPDNQYGEGVILEEYREEYSLIMAQKSQNSEGTIYKKWCFPQYKNKPAETAIPQKVTLGNHREAIAALKYFLSHLEMGK
jgi:hypothetical protein